MTDAPAPTGAAWFHPALLKGRKALITGGGSGLGLAMARCFAALGAELVLCGRRAAPLQAAAEALAPAAVSIAVCDVREPEQVRRMMDAAFEGAPLDILVNNAAANFVAKAETLSPRALDAVIDISMKGAAHGTLEAGRRWISERNQGVVLSIVTSYAWHGSPFVVPSSMAKAGVLAMTRSLASEWGPKGIRLNALAPGAFPTPGAWNRLVPNEELARTHETNNSLGRPGRHEELAALAAFLVSDASGYIHGECVTIDGGRWPHMAGTFGHLHGLSEADWEAMRPAKRG
ncbi:MAG: SDR family oxidoreductase [Pseudomonadota bacterium]